MYSSRYVHTQTLGVACNVLFAPGMIDDYTYKVFTDQITEIGW